MSAAARLDELLYGDDPEFGNLPAQNDRREARDLARDHADDPGEPLNSHRRDCRCPDHRDWLGAS